MELTTFFAWQLLPTTYVQCYQGYYREHELIRWTVSQTVPRTHGVLPVLTRNVPITCKHGQIMWGFVIFIVVLKTVIKVIMLSMSFWISRWDTGPWPYLLLSHERGKKSWALQYFPHLFDHLPILLLKIICSWGLFLRLSLRGINIRHPFCAEVKNY